MTSGRHTIRTTTAAGTAAPIRANAETAGSPTNALASADVVGATQTSNTTRCGIANATRHLHRRLEEARRMVRANRSALPSGRSSGRWRQLLLACLRMLRTPPRQGNTALSTRYEVTDMRHNPE